LIRQFLLALGFLTRLPAGRFECTARDIGRAARWYPLVGALLGAIYLGPASVLCRWFAPLVTALLVTALDTLLTGAMHLDGLADTADGFGGGTTRDDVLRIMRDRAIGSYGACAVCLAIGMKAAAIAVLAGKGPLAQALLATPALSRWSAVFSSAVAGYARPTTDDAMKSVGSPARYIGRLELMIATAIAVAIALPLDWRRGAAALLVVAAVSSVWTWLCKRRIGGVTGDTLGAGIEASECLVLVLFTIG
jgi:cobalamin 5'-phosphate synthase/cobalamin synthase